MNRQESNFRIRLNPANPGQYFACCGLLELAHQIWPGTEGWFEEDYFYFLLPNPNTGQLRDLIEVLAGAEIVSDDESHTDSYTTPLRINGRVNLRLDWWLDKEDGGSDLKTWSGQQSVLQVGKAMKEAMTNAMKNSADLVMMLDHNEVVVEPFYFDARRFAHALDIGFSLNVQGFETVTHPAVEFLSLVGLQRFRPKPGSEEDSFSYCTWLVPLGTLIGAATTSGVIKIKQAKEYTFKLRARDDQKRYKGFSFATNTGDY